MNKTAAHNKEIKKYKIKHKTVSVKNYSKVKKGLGRTRPNKCSYITCVLES